MPDDPNWPRASGWLSGAHSPNPACRLAVLGAPLHLGSITPGRADLAPAAIRSVLHRVTTYDLESNGDLGRIATIALGVLPLADTTPGDALGPLAAGVRDAGAKSNA